MTTIATLGPAGTFSDQVAKDFRRLLPGEVAISYGNSIHKVFTAVSEGCDYGIVPFENLSEGFIPLVIDLLLTSQLKIAAERLVPVSYTCIATVADPHGLDRIFVPFATRGQCSEFLDRLGDSVEVISTETDTLALARMSNSPGRSGAIVPAHFVKPGDFPLVQEGVNDVPGACTRYLVLARESTPAPGCTSPGCKTSLVVFSDDDHPGLLERILSCFSRQHINLLAIASRPAREPFGRHSFFLVLAGSSGDLRLGKALEELERFARVKVLGCCERAV